MSSIDPKVAAILDRAKPEVKDDEAELMELLENGTDEEFFALREKRMQQLHEEFTRAQRLKDEAGHGQYLEIKDEKEVLEITTSTKLCVVHFFKPDFNRCRIMDRHLETLTPAHLDTRFIRINVDNAPFLVAKLKVQVLPCVIAFVDGIGKDRIIGFEGLGNERDSFTSRQLEARLLSCQVLVRAKLTSREPTEQQDAHDNRKEEHGDYDDDDWD